MQNKILLIKYFTVLLLSLPTLLPAQTVGQVVKAVANDREIGDEFGYSVSISGNYAIVGAYRETEDALGGNTLSRAGSAYIFKKDATGNWAEIQKIVANDRDLDDEFGRNVSISGDYAIVGANKEEDDISGANRLYHAGAAYIFKKDEGGIDNWGQVQKIVANDRGPGDQFGWNISLSGNYALIGTPGANEDASGGNTLFGAGAAYIFKKDATGNWVQVQKIVAADRGAGNAFGNSVSISDGYLIVGTYLETEDALGGNTLFNAGAAYIFQKDAIGNWGQVQKIVAADRSVDAQFGWSVSISGNYAIIGAYQEEKDVSGGNTLYHTGAAYIFKKDEGGIDNWGQLHKIVANDRGFSDRFGYNVSISGDYAVVGSSSETDVFGGNGAARAGAVYVFKKDEGGIDSWGQLQKIVAADRTVFSYFGWSVSILGDQMIIGAFRESSNSLNDAGAAYIFNMTFPVSTEVALFETNLAVYPNPVQDKLYIEAASGSAIISNLLGQVLIQKENIQASEPVDVSSLENGHYILTIYDKKGNQSSVRFIKIK